jgi:predicted nucleic acid-binding protein
VDTSAWVRCYFRDEPEHLELRKLILERPEPVVTSELTRVELATAIHAAYRGRRVADAFDLLEDVHADCGAGGPVRLLTLRPDVLNTATELLARYPLRTLDALHLAVAQATAATLAGDEPIVLISRDHRQRAAATALGMRLQ